MYMFVETFRTVGEIFGFLWSRKLWWAFPVVFVLMLVGLLVVVGQATPIGPFIYTLF